MTNRSEWIREAVERHEQRLCRYAAGILHDPERARDVVQEAFIRLCDQPPSVLDGNLTAWLYAVTRNLALDIRRKERRMHTLDPGDLGVADDAPPPGAALERHETDAALARAVEQLPEDQREVVRLRFGEGFSYADIGRVVDKPVGTVGYLIHVAMKTLRDTLDADGVAL